MPKITTTENGYILETNFRFAANMFLLFDKNGDFVEKSADFDYLNEKLKAMENPQEPDPIIVPYFPFIFGERIVLN